jgi:hypothetical protein
MSIGCGERTADALAVLRDRRVGIEGSCGQSAGGGGREEILIAGVDHSTRHTRPGISSRVAFQIIFLFVHDN